MMAMIIFGIIGLILGICCVIGAGFLSGYEEILLQVAHFDSTLLTVCLILMGVAMMVLGVGTIVIWYVNKD